MKKTIAHTDEPLKAVPAVALCGGVALYLLGHVAFRLRNIGTVNKQRVVVAILAAALIYPATELNALATVAMPRRARGRPDRLRGDALRGGPAAHPGRPCTPSAPATIQRAHGSPACPGHRPPAARAGLLPAELRAPAGAASRRPGSAPAGSLVAARADPAQVRGQAQGAAAAPPEAQALHHERLDARLDRRLLAHLGVDASRSASCCCCSCTRWGTCSSCAARGSRRARRCSSRSSARWWP